MRMTRKHLEAKVRIVNSMLGFDPDTLAYNTVGSVQLYGASGFWDRGLGELGDYLTSIAKYAGAADDLWDNGTGVLA